MGWARMMLLGNIGQQIDIDEIETDVEQLRMRLEAQQRVDRSHEEALQTLRREVTDLQLVVAELARLLVASGTLPREAVEHVVQSVDRGSAGAREGR